MPLANATVNNINADGKTRPGAFPESVIALKNSTPELAVARPYAVDLTGWFEGYTHPGTLDANGGSSRVAPIVGVASIQNGTLNFLPSLLNPLLRVIGAFGGPGSAFSQGRRAHRRAGRPLPGLDGARRDLLPGERLPVQSERGADGQMRRILISGAILLAVGAFLFLTVGASNGPSGDPTYKIELDNAFGLVSGADFKVAGVRAGQITGINLPQGCIKGDPAQCHALVTVTVTQKGFGSFRSDAFCQSRPQSLIGEYFVECEPGQTGTVLKPGATIPVTHTQSTIPADLLQDVMRMPYRERFTLIINELGAAVAGRSGDLEAALRRAVPALTETDNLLNLLANDSHTLQQLTVSSDSVITALANNSTGIERFIDEADRTAVHTANQQSNLRLTFQKLPPFLEQLAPGAAEARRHHRRQHPGAHEPERRLGRARPPAHRPAAVLEVGDPGDQDARPGLGHRQAGRAGRQLRRSRT